MELISISKNRLFFARAFYKNRYFIRTGYFLQGLDVLIKKECVLMNLPKTKSAVYLIKIFYWHFTEVNRRKRDNNSSIGKSV